MKLTDWKVARIKQYLPDEDCAEIDKALAEQHDIVERVKIIDGEEVTVKEPKGIPSELMSKMTLTHNAIRESHAPTRGAFGKRGTNRKFQLYQKRLVMKELFEKAKKQLEDEATNESNGSDEQSDSVRDANEEGN